MSSPALRGAFPVWAAELLLDASAPGMLHRKRGTVPATVAEERPLGT